MEQLKLNGIVLSAMPVGEYDKRLVILTKERGKITAFAKGARRTGSPYLAGSRPFSFGEFTVYEGKNAYGLTAINISNYFQELSADIENTYYGFYFMELADYFGREGVDGTETLQLLYVTLRALIKGKVDKKLIRIIYELRTCVINGEYPDVFACIACGSSDGLSWYDEKRGRMYCDECMGKAQEVLKVDDSTVYALQYIVAKPVNELYAFSVSAQVFENLKRIVGRHMSRYIDKQFKSLEVLETLY